MEGQKVENCFEMFKFELDMRNSEGKLVNMVEVWDKRCQDQVRVSRLPQEYACFQYKVIFVNHHIDQS